MAYYCDKKCERCLFTTVDDSRKKFCDMCIKFTPSPLIPLRPNNQQFNGKSPSPLIPLHPNNQFNGKSPLSEVQNNFNDFRTAHQQSNNTFVFAPVIMNITVQSPFGLTDERCGKCHLGFKTNNSDYCILCGPEKVLPMLKYTDHPKPVIEPVEEKPKVKPANKVNSVATGIHKQPLVEVKVEKVKHEILKSDNILIEKMINNLCYCRKCNNSIPARQGYCSHCDIKRSTCAVCHEKISIERIKCGLSYCYRCERANKKY